MEARTYYGPIMVPPLPSSTLLCWPDNTGENILIDSFLANQTHISTPIPPHPSHTHKQAFKYSNPSNLLKSRGSSSVISGNACTISSYNRSQHSGCRSMRYQKWERTVATVSEPATTAVKASAVASWSGTSVFGRVPSSFV